MTRKMKNMLETITVNFRFIINLHVQPVEQKSKIFNLRKVDTKKKSNYYIAKPVLGKSQRSDWFFRGRDLAVRTISVSKPCIFVLEQSRQIHNLQPKQRKKTVNIVILHSETTRRS